MYLDKVFGPHNVLMVYDNAKNELVGEQVMVVDEYGSLSGVSWFKANDGFTVIDMYGHEFHYNSLKEALDKVIELVKLQGKTYFDE